jgi:hypothetical protein
MYKTYRNKEEPTVTTTVPRQSNFTAPSASTNASTSILRQLDQNRGAGDVANRSFPSKTGPGIVSWYKSAKHSLYL